MAASSSLMASQTLILRNPSCLYTRKLTTTSLPSPPILIQLLKPSKPRTLSLHSFPKQHLGRVSSSSSSSSSSIVPQNPPTGSSDPTHTLLAGSTRTITTVLAIALSISRLLASRISSFGSKLKAICSTPSPDEFATIQTLQDSLVCTVGPMFFAAVRARRSETLQTPITLIAAGMKRWLDIYSAVLLVRVLLSWFPNVPWDRQPFTALRDLCDPFLSLFRGIIPPLFNSVDVSPLLAFVVMGMIGSILKVAGIQ